MTPSTAPKGLKFRRMLLSMFQRTRSGKRHGWQAIRDWLARRLIDPPRYQGTLTDRELGSWRVSAKLQLELADQTHEEVDWHGAFWALARRMRVEPKDLETFVTGNTVVKPFGEHLKMKAGDLLRLLDAVEGR